MPITKDIERRWVEGLVSSCLFRASIALDVRDEMAWRKEMHAAVSLALENRAALFGSPEEAPAAGGAAQ